MKIFAVLGATAVAAMPVMAEQVTVKNIPGNIELTVGDEGGRPTYSLSLGGKVMIEPSPL